MRTIELTVNTGRRPGVFDLTPECARFVAAAAAERPDPGGDADGLLSVFVPHATCGIVIMELGSGSEQDLLQALDAVLPRDGRWLHRHGAPGHGSDHVLPAFLSPSITIPVIGGRLELGTWQSIALVDTNVDNERRTVRLSLV